MIKTKKIKSKSSYHRRRILRIRRIYCSAVLFRIIRDICVGKPGICPRVDRLPTLLVSVLPPVKGEKELKENLYKTLLTYLIILRIINYSTICYCVRLLLFNFVLNYYNWNEMSTYISSSDNFDQKHFLFNFIYLRIWR